MKTLNQMYRSFLKIFGDIKIFPWPMFIIYNPEGYGVKGEDVRKIIQLSKPGDILVRGFKRYIDGYFIPGVFSHAGLVVNDGNVIHSMAEGVFKQDVINFCRCDFMAVLRFKESKVTEDDIQQACDNAEKLLGKKYDFEFEDNDDEYYCTEMVLKAWEHKLIIKPAVVKLLFGLIKKETINPDQFRKHKDLSVVYQTNNIS